MSSEIGRVKGQSHETSVSVSAGGVEIAVWKTPAEGFGDGMTSNAARGLAALLLCAADRYDRAVTEARGPVRGDPLPFR